MRPPWQIKTAWGSKFNVIYIKNINYTKNYLTFNKRLVAPSKFFTISFCAWSKTNSTTKAIHCHCQAACDIEYLRFYPLIYFQSEKTLCNKRNAEKNMIFLYYYVVTHGLINFTQSYQWEGSCGNHFGERLQYQKQKNKKTKNKKQTRIYGNLAFPYRQLQSNPN